MINSLMLLAFEANGVIALRMMKLMRGGRSARREAELMVSEKIQAAFDATAGLLAGASSEKIVHRIAGTWRQMRNDWADLILAEVENVR